ncbi:MAG: tetratricopeptide repeat protein, partial [Gemmataceae bacterium]
DPTSLIFRQALRRAQKEKYGNNLRGSPFAFFSMPRLKARLKTSKASGEYIRVLSHGEQILVRNPWDLGTQMDMAEAFDALGLPDLAIFSLDQARQKYPKDPTLNRALARLFEKRGDFQKAIVLWQLVKDVQPTDVEASHKAKDLAASETIARGQYQESVAGTKSSPVLDKITEQNAERGDRNQREVAPLLKRIEADPTEPSLYVQLAMVYRKLGQEDRARAALQQGLAPTGQHFTLQTELLELDLVPLRKNVDLIDQRLKNPSPDSEDDTEELARNRQGLLNEILAREISIYRTRAERFPAELSHRLELGLRLMKAGKLDEAIAELQQTRRDDKLKGKAGLYLGQCFQKRNNWRLAQRNYEEALVALPKTEEAARKEALFLLASGLAEQGELPRAIDLGHELANLDFGYRNIGTLLDDWQSRGSKP